MFATWRVGEKNRQQTRKLGCRGKSKRRLGGEDPAKDSGAESEWDRCTLHNNKISWPGGDRLGGLTDVETDRTKDPANTHILRKLRLVQNTNNVASWWGLLWDAIHDAIWRNKKAWYKQVLSGCRSGSKLSSGCCQQHCHFRFSKKSCLSPKLRVSCLILWSEFLAEQII